MKQYMWKCLHSFHAKSAAQGRSPCRAASREFKHAVVELIIHTFLAEQFFVVAALDDAAMVQHHDGVGIAHGGEAVGDDEDGAALHEACLLYTSIVHLMETVSPDSVMSASLTSALATVHLVEALLVTAESLY